MTRVASLTVTLLASAVSNSAYGQPQSAATTTTAQPIDEFAEEDGEEIVVVGEKPRGAGELGR